jgi:hypothetical protein
MGNELAGAKDLQEGAENMNRLLVLLWLLFLAGALAGAQDTLGSQAKPGAQEPSAPANSQASSAQSSVIRGCVSGSAGNFTLTDQNGMQYKLMGSDAALQSKIGHEVEITGIENQSTTPDSEDQESESHATGAFQVSAVRDVSGSCRLGRDGNSQPLSKDQADRNVDAGKPQLMAMLQQPAAPAPDSSSPQNGTPAPAQSQTNSPMSGQTPATPQSSTASNPAEGSDSATQSGTTSGNAQSGQAGGQQQTSSSPAASPTANDQNKPLYERQATDVPWATHSKANDNADAPASPNPQ